MDEAVQFSMRARSAFLSILLACAVVGSAAPAHAACHSFTIEVSPATVSEGGRVTVTVGREGNVGPSQVNVSSVNETAKAGSDYTAVSQAVAFSSELEKSFTVSTIENTTHESTETFRLHLSNGEGCVNSNYRYGADARVTIQDDDASAVSPAPNATKTTAASAPTTPPAAATSPSPTPSATTFETPSETPAGTPEPSVTELAESSEEGGGGLSGGALAGIIAGALAVAGAAGVVVRRRARSSG